MSRKFNRETDEKARKIQCESFFASFRLFRGLII